MVTFHGVVGGLMGGCQKVDGEFVPLQAGADNPDRLIPPHSLV